LSNGVAADAVRTELLQSYLKDHRLLYLFFREIGDAALLCVRRHRMFRKSYTSLWRP